MNRVKIWLISFALMVLSAGCSLNGLNGLLKGSKLGNIDLSNVDPVELLRQLGMLLSGFGAE